MRSTVCIIPLTFLFAWKRLLNVAASNQTRAPSSFADYPTITVDPAMNYSRLRVTHAIPKEHAMVATGSVVWLARVFFFVVAIGLFLSTLYFVLRTANPVMRSDAWYFFDVFVRKAVDGTLTLGDFFIKRQGADHAQPLFKLILLVELHFYQLDDSLQSIIGVIAAAVCAGILCKVVLATRLGSPSDALRYLACSAICALLFSAQVPGNWTWPLVALGYLTIVPVLLFFWALWAAWESGRFYWLAATVLLLAVVADDSAIIVVAAAMLSVLLIALLDSARRRGAIKIAAVVIGMTCVVRIAYSFAVTEGGGPLASLTSQIDPLLTRVASEGALWITIPLTSSLMAHITPYGVDKSLWDYVQAFVMTALILAQVWFWWRAICRDYDRSRFFAVCLMVISYAWVAGILLYRVSSLGTDYLYQGRYVQLYGFNVIALLLMAASSQRRERRSSPALRYVQATAFAIGCLFIVGLQTIYIKSAWYNHVYLVQYFRGMESRLVELSQQPENVDQCYAELSICNMPLIDRADIMKMMVDHKLNVFSPKVRRRHPYLEQGFRLPAH